MKTMYLQDLSIISGLNLNYIRQAKSAVLHLRNLDGNILN
jgi:hypothetical protein